MNLSMGVDVSKYQGVVDWSKLKEYGYTFAIIRAGYGMFANQVDPYFTQNIKEAASQGFDIGVYWFSYALNEADAEVEASLCYQTIKPYLSNINIGVFFDYEYSSVNYYCKTYQRAPIQSLTKKMFLKFHNYLQSYNIKTGIYTNYDYINSYFKGLDYDSKEFLLWFADPSNKYRDKYSWDICQTGILEMDGSKFDINIMKVEIEENPPIEHEWLHIIEHGDTLSGIALQYGVTLEQVLQWNPEYKSNPNLILPGQTVKIKNQSYSGFAVGDLVKIKKSAKCYFGVNILIPEYCKGIKLTIQQLNSDRLLLKEIYSWVSIKDVEKAD